MLSNGDTEICLEYTTTHQGRDYTGSLGTSGTHSVGTPHQLLFGPSLHTSLELRVRRSVSLELAG